MSHTERRLLDVIHDYEGLERHLRDEGRERLVELTQCRAKLEAYRHALRIVRFDEGRDESTVSSLRI